MKHLLDSLQNLVHQTELNIFDLDGTLYEDTDHFDYYARLLAKQLPEENQQPFLNEYEKMIAGTHTVTIGKVYDVVRDTVLQVDAMNRNVQKAWTWDGHPVEESQIRELYPHPIEYDFDSMIAIGDGWWLPNVCAKHFGATNTQHAYNRTKEFMASDQFQLTKISGLKETLHHVQQKKTNVLVTNSTEDDVERLLHILELDGLFDRIITKAKKPQYTQRIFSELIAEYDIPAQQTLSIGDNFLNEIAPAIQMDMNTIFIDFHQLAYPEYEGIKVKSIADILDALQEI